MNREPGAVRLSTPGIDVVLDAERGGRIVNLTDVVRDREWLVQPARTLADPAEPGTAFTDGDMSGWDEMFPTVLPCHYPTHRPDDPEVELPDHGELWTARWQVTERGDRSVVMTAQGDALPYRFTRRATVERSRLLLTYRVDVTGAVPLIALWAAHPQFRCEPGTRIILPKDVRTVLDVSDPAHPVRTPWPGALDGRVSALPATTGRKLYLEPDAAPRWARLVDPCGAALDLSWDGEPVSYLGLWLDHRRYSHEACVCLEPSTGFYDDLSLAAAQGRAMLVAPGAPARWSLLVRLDQHATGSA